MYIELPKAYYYVDKVLKLIKSVYVLEQAPLNWFNKMSRGLCNFSLESRNFDTCLFIGEILVCLVYIDGLFLYERKNIILAG